jgi:hypothetical protein
LPLDDSFRDEFRFSYLYVLIYIFAVVISACKSTNFHLIIKHFQYFLLNVRDIRTSNKTICIQRIKFQPIDQFIFFYFVPKYNKNIPIKTPIRSITLSFMFLSRMIIAPYKNGTITPERRMVDTTEIIESGNDNA